jgi:hypothetical protein
MACALIAAVMTMSVAVRTQSGEPGTCPNDSKLLNGGPTLVFGEGPGTWWGLVIDGLVTAGLLAATDQINYLNQVFGTHFTTLEELKTYNLHLIEDVYDENRNGLVCAFDLRGTRAHFDNPLVDLTFFGVSDDRIEK